MPRAVAWTMRRVRPPDAQHVPRAVVQRPLPSPVHCGAFGTLELVLTPPGGGEADPKALGELAAVVLHPPSGVKRVEPVVRVRGQLYMVRASTVPML